MTSPGTPVTGILIAERSGNSFMGKRKPKRKYRGKYIRGAISDDMDLGTLAGNTGVLSNLAPAGVDRATKVSSIEATYSLSSWTPATNTGPILVLLAHSDYSLTEVEEFIEASESWNESDLVAQEVANRKIRRIGVFDVPPDSAITDIITLVGRNGSRVIKTKLNWLLQEGQQVNVIAYNTGPTAVGTTDPDLHTAGHANLWPQ